MKGKLMKMAIMLDPCFKSLVLWRICWVCFERLNLTIVNASITITIVDVGEDFEKNMCGVEA
jgi:hypothetical protein